MLQESEKMVLTALPEDLDSMKGGNYYNMQLPERMEQK